MTRPVRTSSKAPLLPSDRIQITRLGPPGEKGPTVYIYADVLEEIIYHANYRDSDSATLLLGGSYRGPAGEYVEIQGFAESTYLDKTLDLYGIFSRSYTGVCADLAQNNPVQSVLGWSANTRQTLAKMSRDQLIIHRTFFNAPQQIFLALDTEQEALSLYRHDETGKVFHLGFNLISTRGATLNFNAGKSPEAQEESTSEPKNTGSDHFATVLENQLEQEPASLDFLDQRDDLEPPILESGDATEGVSLDVHPELPDLSPPWESEDEEAASLEKAQTEAPEPEKSEPEPVLAPPSEDPLEPRRPQQNPTMLDFNRTVIEAARTETAEEEPEEAPAPRARPHQKPTTLDLDRTAAEAARMIPEPQDLPEAVDLPAPGTIHELETRETYDSSHDIETREQYESIHDVETRERYDSGESLEAIDPATLGGGKAAVRGASGDPFFSLLTESTLEQVFSSFPSEEDASLPLPDLEVEETTPILTSMDLPLEPVEMPSEDTVSSLDEALHFLTYTEPPSEGPGTPGPDSSPGGPLKDPVEVLPGSPIGDEDGLDAPSAAASLPFHAPPMDAAPSVEEAKRAVGESVDSLKEETRKLQRVETEDDARQSLAQVRARLAQMRKRRKTLSFKVHPPAQSEDGAQNPQSGEDDVQDR